MSERCTGTPDREAGRRRCGVCGPCRRKRVHEARRLARLRETTDGRAKIRIKALRHDRNRSIREKGYPPGVGHQMRTLARLYRWAAHEARRHAGTLKREAIRAANPPKYRKGVWTNRYREDPEYRARRLAQIKSYKERNAEKVAAYRKEHNQKPEVKARRNERQKLYNQTPRMRAYRHQYGKLYAAKEEGRLIKNACTTRFNHSWKFLLIDRTGVCWSDYQKLNKEEQCAVQVLFLVPICNRLVREGKSATLRSLEKEVLEHLKISVTL